MGNISLECSEHLAEMQRYMPQKVRSLWKRQESNMILMLSKVQPLVGVDAVSTVQCVEGRGVYPFTRSGCLALPKNNMTNQIQLSVQYLPSNLH